MLLVGAALVVVVAGLKQAAPLLIPLVFSAFLAAVSAPFVFWLERRLPAVVAVSMVVLMVLGVLVAVGALVGSSVNEFVAAAPRYQDGLNELFGGLGGWLQSLGVSRDKVREMVNAGSLMRFLGGTLTGLASALSNMLLVVLTVAFMLLEATTLTKKFRLAMDDPTADISHYKKVVTEIQKYVVIKTYVSLGTGVSLGLYLWILGVDYPLLWGLVVFLLNFVPNIGSIIAAIPAVALALVQYGWGRALAALVGFVAVNMIVGNVVEPMLMGRRLGLSTLVVFLSLIFWGWLWGPVGMLLSVPLTMIIKILLENSQWYGAAVLLGGDPDREAPSLPPPHVRNTKPPLA